MAKIWNIFEKCNLTCSSVIICLLQSAHASRFTLPEMISSTSLPILNFAFCSRLRTFSLLWTLCALLIFFSTLLFWLRKLFYGGKRLFWLHVYRKAITCIWKHTLLRNRNFHVLLRINTWLNGRSYALNNMSSCKQHCTTERVLNIKKIH